MQIDTTDHVREAMLYDKHPEGRVLCRLCPHLCLIDKGKRGICQVRENRDGVLYSLVYGRTVVQNVDPIEKKPLFHFYPGSMTYSLATHGCNFHCQYCTNWEISQRPTTSLQHADTMASPSAIVTSAQRVGCRSIAFTYVEPTIFFEYADAIAREAHAEGLNVVYKTNGFMTSEMLDHCQTYLDAANVDLKAFSDTAYQSFGGRLQPVLDSLKSIKDRGIWLEVTTVIIPAVNDDPAELHDMASFIANELGVDTPWHITRFFPAYKMLQVPPAPSETLHRAYDIGRQAGLLYVYMSNNLESGVQDTHCATCGAVVIRRHAAKLEANDLSASGCSNCGTLLPGVGM